MSRPTDDLDGARGIGAGAVVGFLIWVLVAVLLAGCSAPTPSESAEVERLEQRVDALEAMVANLTTIAANQADSLESQLTINLNLLRAVDRLQGAPYTLIGDAPSCSPDECDITWAAYIGDEITGNVDAGVIPSTDVTTVGVP